MTSLSERAEYTRDTTGGSCGCGAPATGGMRINTNLDALVARRHLFSNDSGPERATERLSTGLRINRAADDAAGLTISEQLRTRIHIA